MPLRTPYSPIVVSGNPSRRIVTPASDMFSISIPWNLSGGVTLAQAWPGANDPIALPFAMTKPGTVYQLGWYNGSGVQSGNVDIGIYDANFNRKVSGGGTAAVGTSVWQWVNVADTYIPRGRYYLAVVRDGTATHASCAIPGTAAALALFGAMDSTTASYPLPDPLAGMVAAATFSKAPICAIAFRDPF